MKKLLLLLLFILIGCSKDDGLHTRYYLGGDKEERTFKNNVKEGPSVYYFSNGDSVDIQCTDWHSSMPYDDSLRVSLWSAEFGEWVSH